MKKVLLGIIFVLILILGFIIFSYNKKITFRIPEFDNNAVSIPSKINKS